MGKIYEPPKKQKRAAAYARVSLETDRLSHSLSAQVGYYTEYIRANPDWKFAGVYADSFISGTETARRAEFRRLVADCESGKIDVVLCKSISRFARNTVDLLNTVRRLKELGIEVFFEKENISSLSSDGELLLTILASFAQEESRSISENVKWGIRKRFRSGGGEPRNKSVLGYRYANGRYEVVPEEAETVRLIFMEYAKGVPLREITRRLKSAGAKTRQGFDFSYGAVDYIVRNEIYTGDIVLQKTFVKDHISHNKAKNRGELPQYRFCGCHEPIIDRETFARAQAEAKRRAAAKPVYCFSGRIICGCCEKPYTRRSNAGKYACWHCRQKTAGGICSNVKLNEEKLKRLSALVLGADEFDEEEFSQNIARITAREDKTLEYEFYDGRTIQCQYE